MKKILTTFFCLTVISAGCSAQKITTQSPSVPTVTVGSQKISIEIAQSIKQKELGLSFRDSLPQNSGLLFDFRNDTNKTPNFWMKDMKFPIDIIWIKGNKVIGISSNLPAPQPNTPDALLPLYPAPGEIDYALEVNANFVIQHKIKTGDKVQL